MTSKLILGATLVALTTLPAIAQNPQSCPPPILCHDGTSATGYSPGFVRTTVTRGKTRSTICDISTGTGKWVEVVKN